MKWKVWAFIVVLLSIAVFSGCVNNNALSSTTGGEKELIKVKISMLPYFSYAPLFIADEEGYFEEQGIEVEFVKFPFSSQSLPALAQGDIDVSAGLISVGLFNGIERGMNVKIVADKGHVALEGCSEKALLARRELVEAGELEGPEQLDGKKIAFIPGGTENYIIEQLLVEGGLTIDNITIVDVPTPAQQDAIETGAIDLTMTSEPWVTRLLDTGNTEIWMPYNEIMPGFQSAIIIYGPNFLEKNPDAGKRFMTAYLKAVRQYNEGHTDRNLELLANFTGQEIEFLNRVCWPTFRSDGSINIESMLNFQNWAMEKGYLDQVVSDERFWDGRFIER